MQASYEPGDNALALALFAILQISVSGADEDTTSFTSRASLPHPAIHFSHAPTLIESAALFLALTALGANKLLGHCIAQNFLEPWFQ